MPTVLGPAPGAPNLVMIDPGNGAQPVPYPADKAQDAGWTTYDPLVTAPAPVPQGGPDPTDFAHAPLTNIGNALKAVPSPIASLMGPGTPQSSWGPNAIPPPKQVSSQVAADETKPIIPAAGASFAGGTPPVVDPNAALYQALLAGQKPGGGGGGNGSQVMKDIDANIGNVQTAIGEQGKTAAQGASDIQAQTQANADALKTELTAQDALHAQQDQEAKGREAQIEQFANQAASMHTDPNRLWHSQDTGQKVAQTMAMIFGGLGTWGGRGPNIGMEMWHQAVQNDLQAQRDDYEHAKDKTEAAKSLYGMAMQRFGRQDVAAQMHNAVMNQVGQQMLEGIKAKAVGADQQAALNVAQQHMGMEGTKLKLDAQTQLLSQSHMAMENQALKQQMMLQGPAMQILHQQMVAPLINKVAQGGTLTPQERMTMNTMRPDLNKLEVTGYGYAKDEDTAKDARKTVTEAAPAISSIQALKTVMKRAEDNPLLKADPVWRSQAIAAAGAARRSVMSTEGFMRLNEQAKKEFNEEIPDKPWDYLINTVGPRINDVLHNQADVRDAKLKAAGLPIPVNEEETRW